MAMREGTEERRAELYREAVAMIKSDYARPLRIEGVARELATSRRQLQRAFAEIGNTSFREVLASVRMRHARNLLADPSVPVGRVAASVGYHQPAQFAKSFRRHHGTPPTNFRRALAADDKVTLLTPRDDRSVAPAYATAG
ncbi:MAG: AraC family transcriptional regulator [Thermoleophilaceae bacterium]|jgi:AraC family transcriptional regulator of adaptative response / methylphosphotriester-DNA alkyltransferase methyltransferase|nr:AraC family transcriptional regulator [Thermoleophilaceae bacterium]